MDCFVGECPIHLAARSGHKDTIEMLLDHGAEINKKNANNQTPLFLSAANETENMIKNETMNSENLEVVQMLIERGADLDAWDIDGFTPIMIAAEKGHKYVVQYLVEKGAKLDIKDKDDHSLFHICAKHGQVMLDSDWLTQNNTQF